jgi:hypothetical protein
VVHGKGNIRLAQMLKLTKEAEPQPQRSPSRSIKSTPRGFEPLRAEPNGFLVHLLSRSDTVSCCFKCQ